MSDWIAAISLGVGALGVLASEPLPTPAGRVGSRPSASIAVDEAAPGDLVTFHFIATTTKGREVASSERRGMPFTVRLGASGTAPALTETLMGSKPGDTRKTGLMRADLLMPELKVSQGPNDPMVYRLVVLRVQRTADR